MYQTGQLKFKEVTDTTTADYDVGEWFYLPHSCDKWVIGGPEQARALIADLEKLLRGQT